ncbi:MAG: imidazolonepropionase [Flavobacteriaceae bacterium]|jgi:imidazolonepropionase|nr:imidazolonepropionase [Flavobacteriaceae bacterium]MDA0719933.1 imidazolonepropionase [Bacteroidota bacterium]
MKTLLINIHQLLQIREPEVSFVAGGEMRDLPLIQNAWLLIDKDQIADFGPMETAPLNATKNIIDCTDRVVMPTYCDSHTHIVYAGERVDEFVQRLEGKSYQEIAALGGGILNSAARLDKTSEKQLYEQAAQRLELCAYQGTGALEIKSGYGLNLEAELKMLRVAKRLSEKYPVAIKTTFLGAHALPELYKNRKDEYVQQVCKEMIPEVAAQKLADYIDVFCEEGYFDLEDTEKILSAGARFGLKGKIHVNQFNAIGGVALGVAMEVLSVDHLEELIEEDLMALENSQTMPVALPGCSLFLDIPFTPARAIIDRGLPLALATDFNPGSAPSGNMNLVVSLACMRMKMTPAEALNAATINGAYAMGLEATHGSITKGKKASLIITDPLKDFSHLPYDFGQNHIDQVILNGRLL